MDSNIVLSIIIPTLNEEEYIERTISMIHKNASGKIEYEIIVVDSGSTDETIDLALGYHVNVQACPAFKGLKYMSLNHGAASARGKVLLFLDADCIVPERFDQSLLDSLEEEGVVGGAFEYKSEDRSFWMRVIEKINHLRYRMNKDYFGDQGVFCDREIFLATGGFPQKPLMEAAYFCRALSKFGKLKLVEKDLITSSRRFVGGGILKVMTKDTWIWLQFLIGMDVSRYASTYWSENEKPSRNKKS